MDTLISFKRTSTGNTAFYCINDQLTTFLMKCILFIAKSNGSAVIMMRCLDAIKTLPKIATNSLLLLFILSYERGTYGTLYLPLSNVLL